MSTGAGPPPPGVVPNFEHPEDVLHTINFVCQVLSLVLITAFMLVRLYAKTVVSPPLYLDDWFAFAAWLFCLGYAATGFVMGAHGGGYHVWEITPENLTGFYKGLYADTIVYGPTSFFTKTTLILMVTRVFATSRKTVVVGYIFIIVMLCYYLPVLIIKAQICRPIEGYWDKTIESKCFNQRAVFVADTSMSAVSDTAVLCLPIPIALTLRMTWQKRLKVIVMLSAGGAATAFSIARMVLVLQLQLSTDDPIDFVRFNLLGTAETTIGIICGCFPAVNLLMRQRSTTPNSSSHSNSSSRKLKFLCGSKLKTQHLTGTTTRRFSTTTQSPTLLTTGMGGNMGPGGGGDGGSGGDIESRPATRQAQQQQQQQLARTGDATTPTPGLQTSSLVFERPTSIRLEPRSPTSPPFSPTALRGSQDSVFPTERWMSLAQAGLTERGSLGFGGGPSSTRPQELTLETSRQNSWYQRVRSPTFGGGPHSPTCTRPAFDIDEEAGR